MRFRFALPVLLVMLLAGCGSSQSGSNSPASTPVAGQGSGNSTLTAAQNHVHSIVIMPHNPSSLYMGAHYYLSQSNDGGKTWHRLLKQMMLSMTLNPARPATLYGVALKAGLIMSIDGGRHWKPVAGITKGLVTGVVLNPATGVLFAYGAGIFRSTDGGLHWTKLLPKDSFTSMTVGDAQTAYAATGNGLLVSHDGGLHWKTISAVGNQPVIQVVASHRVGYAVTAIGVFKSGNDGGTWTLLTSAPQGIEFLGVSPSNPSEVFGEIGGQGFVASHNGGTTWRAANTGIKDRNFNASTIKVSPSSPNVLYTAAWGVHFYASHDGGRHWVQTATLVH